MVRRNAMLSGQQQIAAGVGEPVATTQASIRASCVTCSFAKKILTKTVTDFSKCTPRFREDTGIKTNASTLF